MLQPACQGSGEQGMLNQQVHPPHQKPPCAIHRMASRPAASACRKQVPAQRSESVPAPKPSLQGAARRPPAPTHEGGRTLGSSLPGRPHHWLARLQSTTTNTRVKKGPGASTRPAGYQVTIQPLRKTSRQQPLIRCLTQVTSKLHAKCSHAQAKKESGAAKAKVAHATCDLSCNKTPNPTAMPRQQL
jgi:hypothetical protein